MTQIIDEARDEHMGCKRNDGTAIVAIAAREECNPRPQLHLFKLPRLDSVIPLIAEEDQARQAS